MKILIKNLDGKVVDEWDYDKTLSKYSKMTKSVNKDNLIDFLNYKNSYYKYELSDGIEKSKYTKRTGSKGNYKYEYDDDKKVKVRSRFTSGTSSQQVHSFDKTFKHVPINFDIKVEPGNHGGFKGTIPKGSTISSLPGGVYVKFPEGHSRANEGNKEYGINIISSKINLERISEAFGKKKETKKVTQQIIFDRIKKEFPHLEVEKMSKFDKVKIYDKKNPKIAVLISPKKDNEGLVNYSIDTQAHIEDSSIRKQSPWNHSYHEDYTIDRVISEMKNTSMGRGDSSKKDDEDIEKGGPGSGRTKEAKKEEEKKRKKDIQSGADMKFGKLDKLIADLKKSLPNITQEQIEIVKEVYLEKAKYIKRTGSKGKYKYEYAKDDPHVVKPAKPIFDESIPKENLEFSSFIFETMKNDFFNMYGSDNYRKVFDNAMMDIIDGKDPNLERPKWMKDDEWGQFNKKIDKIKDKKDKVVDMLSYNTYWEYRPWMKKDTDKKDLKLDKLIADSVKKGGPGSGRHSLHLVDDKHADNVKVSASNNHQQHAKHHWENFSPEMHEHIAKQHENIADKKKFSDHAGSLEHRNISSFHTKAAKDKRSNNFKSHDERKLIQGAREHLGMKDDQIKAKLDKMDPKSKAKAHELLNKLNDKVAKKNKELYKR